MRLLRGSEAPVPKWEVLAGERAAWVELAPAPATVAGAGARGVWVRGDGAGAFVVCKERLARALERQIIWGRGHFCGVWALTGHRDGLPSATDTSSSSSRVYGPSQRVWGDFRETRHEHHLIRPCITPLICGLLLECSLATCTQYSCSLASCKLSTMTHWALEMRLRSGPLGAPASWRGGGGGFLWGLDTYRPLG
jgi:hypothetical protein